MRKISGRVLSSKPVSLSRAAKLITRFSSVENGASPAVSIYLQRTAEAFNNLVQFHKGPAEKTPDAKVTQKLQADSVEEKVVKDVKRKLESGETGKGVAEPNLDGDDVEGLNSEEKKKKKKKKKSKSKSGGDDSKKRRVDSLDS